MKTFIVMHKKRIIHILATILVMTACIMLITEAKMQAYAGGFKLSEEIEPSTLFYGNTINVPTGKFDGKKAQLNVVFPDGTIVNKPKTLTFTQAGRYELIYTSKNKDKYLVEKRELVIANEQFFTTDGKRNYSYGMHEQTGREGLNVTFSKDNSFQVNKAINLSETSVDNPALMFTIPVNNEYAFDAGAIMMRFTDIYDSNNYFELKFSLSNTIWNRVYAAAVDRSFGGYDNSTNGSYSSYGSVFNMYPANNYADSSISLNDIFKKQQFSVWYDETENTVYMSYYHFKADKMMINKICDFDNVDEQSAPWVGFSTGEAFISIEYDEYSNKTAQMQILAMHDINLAEINFDDKQKTQITLKQGAEDLPIGKKGYYYPIHKVAAVNPYCGGEIDYTTRVFYQYPRKDGLYHGTLKQYSYECDVKDGYFKTDYAGTYAICYRATDHYGEISELVVNVTVDDKVAPFGELVVGKQVTSGEIGNMIYLADCKLPTGGIAPYSIEVKVKKGDVSQTVYGNDIDGRYFIPKSVGKYTVTITAYDYVRNSTSYSYKINIKDATAPSFISEAKLPRYLIADTEYVLPELIMKDYRDGSMVPAKIAITDANGKTNYKPGSKYTFVADKDGNAVIKYYFGKNEKVYTIPVVDVINDNEDIDFTKFFVNEGVKAKTTTSGVVFTTAKEGSTSFIRDISVRDLAAGIDINGLGDKFESFIVTLVDSMDSSIRVEFKFTSDGTYVYKYANGVLVSKELSVDVTTIADISYDHETNQISMGGSLGKLTMKDGSAFGGFTSGKVYMSFHMKGVTGPSEVVLKSVKEQKMNIDILSDRIKPVIYADHDYGVVIHKEGDVIDLYELTVDDVLSGYVNITLTATKDNKIITSDSGVSLKEVAPQKDSMTLSEQGTYSLLYTASDWYGNEISYLVRFYVVEKNAPKVEVSDWEKEFEAGKIYLPKVTATDDVTEQPVVYMTVFGPKGKIYKTNGETFNATVKGQYVLRITVFDEAGNTTIVEKEFTIK